MTLVHIAGIPQATEQRCIRCCEPIARSISIGAGSVFMVFEPWSMVAQDRHGTFPLTEDHEVMDEELTRCKLYEA